MRLAFAGTPSTAVPSLRALLDSPRHEVVAVITRPHARAGRGRPELPSPVEAVAVEAGVPVLAPSKAGDPDFLARLAELRVDCCPVVAYGAILPSRGAGHTAAWLGQPALLAVAGVARRGASPARHSRRRRHHRSIDVPDRGRSRHRTGVWGRDRADPALRHGGRPARAPGRLRRPAARRHDGRDRGRHPRPAPAIGGRCVARGQDHC